jgi:hypothetical protein
MGRRVGDLDFGDFPNNITLTYGSDGEREYYEYWRGRKGIVIQRGSRTSYYIIFFIDGRAIRAFKTPDIRAYKTVEEAVSDLEKFGFSVRIEKDGGEEGRGKY